MNKYIKLICNLFQLVKCLQYCQFLIEHDGIFIDYILIKFINNILTYFLFYYILINLPFNY